MLFALVNVSTVFCSQVAFRVSDFCVPPSFVLTTQKRMDVVLIYGPPASGKLTIAKILARLTGFRLLHNHLTADLAASLFEFGTQEYYNYTAKLRIDAVKTAVSHGILGLVVTYCYLPSLNLPFLEAIVHTTKSTSGQLSLVRLSPTPEALESRVVNFSRQAHNKISTVFHLREVLGKCNYYLEIPNFESLTIDNTRLTAEEVARLVYNWHFFRESSAIHLGDAGEGR